MSTRTASTQSGKMLKLHCEKALCTVNGTVRIPATFCPLISGIAAP
jgi:hypothetical protein